MVEGGWLQTPWPIDTKVVDGSEFVTLALTDRLLAKALGMNMSERSPLARCSLFPHMAAKRDAEVDRLIREAKLQKDPMADEASKEQVAKPMPMKGRASGFADADLPATIILTLAPFVTPEGERVDEHRMRVVTTPKRRVNVSMEALAENFEWLRKACQVEWDNGPPPPKQRPPPEEDADLPELRPPCKYRKTLGGKLTIACCYRQGGAWKVHQRVVAMVSGQGNAGAEDMIRRCEGEVLRFYRENHESTAAEGEGPEAGAEALKDGEEDGAEDPAEDSQAARSSEAS